MTFVTGDSIATANLQTVHQRSLTVDAPRLPEPASANEPPARARDRFLRVAASPNANEPAAPAASGAAPQQDAWSTEPAAIPKPSEQQPLAEMEVADATRYFGHLDIAFADIDAHRGVMHGPMAWPDADTKAGQERVENLVVKLFKPKERPESAYTTLILYMPAPGDTKRLEKISGFASAMARSLRTLVETGVIPLGTSTVVYQSMARHAANGSPPKDAAAIVRMFERKRLEVVAVAQAPR